MKLSIDELYLILKHRFEGGYSGNPQTYKDIIDVCDSMMKEAQDILKELESHDKR